MSGPSVRPSIIPERWRVTRRTQVWTSCRGSCWRYHGSGICVWCAAAGSCRIRQSRLVTFIVILLLLLLTSISGTWGNEMLTKCALSYKVKPELERPTPSAPWNLRRRRCPPPPAPLVTPLVVYVLYIKPLFLPLVLEPASAADVDDRLAGQCADRPSVQHHPLHQRHRHV